MVNTNILPKAILARTFGEITTIKDLRSLRFVSRIIPILVTAQLFHKVFVRFQRDDLARLMAISIDLI